jgi:hypothetical protein
MFNDIFMGWCFCCMIYEGILSAVYAMNDDINKSLFHLPFMVLQAAMFIYTVIQRAS